MLVMALDDAARIGFCKFTVVCGSDGRPDSVLGIHVKEWGVGGLGIDVGNVATCKLDISATGNRRTLCSASESLEWGLQRAADALIQLSPCRRFLIYLE